MAYAHLESATATDIGLKRTANEDAVLAMDAAGVFCIADGMGGAARGELASRWCVEAIESACAAGNEPGRSTLDCIRKAVNRASHRIRKLAIREHISGTGTTVVVLSFDAMDPGQACILHAGDSRCYRLRDGDLGCLTRDHSMAAAAGVKHDRNLPAVFQGVITRAVGLADTVEMDATPVDVRPGDLFLLCSDGLNRMVSDRRIQEALKNSDGNLADRARDLIERAKEAGGHDNVSVILVAVGNEAIPVPPDQTDPVAVSTGLPPAPGVPDPAAVSAPESNAGANPSVTASPDARDPKAPAATCPLPEPSAPKPAQTEVRRAGPPPTPVKSWHTVVVLVLLILIPVAVWSLRRASIPRIEIVYDPPARQHTARDASPQTTAPETGTTAPVADPSNATAPALSEPPVTPPAPEQPGAPEAAWRARLRQQVDHAVPNGTWGGVADLLDTAEAENGGLRHAIPEPGHAVIWMQVWRKAADNPDYAHRNYREYVESISAIGRDLGIDALPGIPAELPDAAGPAFADAYCKALIQCRRTLAEALNTAVDRAGRECDVLGDNPRATLEALHRFCRRRFRPETFPVSQQANDIATLEAWLQADRQQAVPLMGIGGIPRDRLQRLTRNRIALREGWMRAIEACPAAVRHWRRVAPDRREQSARIGDLVTAVLERYEESKEAHPVQWPAARDLIRIRTLLASIRDFMETAPATDAARDGVY